MPKRNNSKNNVSSKNILKKIKHLSDYYKKKLLKGGAVDPPVQAATGETQRVAAVEGSGTANAVEGSGAVAAAVEGSGTANAVEGSGAVATGEGVGFFENIFQSGKKVLGIGGGKSKKRRNNKRRKQTNKKRN